MNINNQKMAKDDYLKDLTIPDWRDRFNTSLSWSFEWASTVLVNRYGKIPNGDQTVYLSPTYLVNWSGTYQISKSVCFNH